MLIRGAPERILTREEVLKKLADLKVVKRKITAVRPVEAIVGSMVDWTDAIDPAGTFVVELETSTQAPGDLNKVDSLIYDLDTTGGC